MQFAFSENVRDALAQARREAAAYRHRRVDTEHVLLGLVGSPDNIASALLATQDVTREEVRTRVESVTTRGKSSNGIDVPYTSRAKHVLELAIRQAREQQDRLVNTGHVFVSILRDADNVGASVLTACGFDADEALRHLVALMRTGRSEGSASPPAPRISRSTAPMDPGSAAIALRWMLKSPRVAAIFARRGVDVEALIRDLVAEQQRA